MKTEYWRDLHTLMLLQVISLVAQMVKTSAYNARDPGSVPGLGRSSGEGNVNPLQDSCLENPMNGWRSLVGYSPWGRQESDMTEQLHFLSMLLQHYSQ